MIGAKTKRFGMGGLGAGADRAGPEALGSASRRIRTAMGRRSSASTSRRRTGRVPSFRPSSSTITSARRRSSSIRARTTDRKSRPEPPAPWPRSGGLRRRVGRSSAAPGAAAGRLGGCRRAPGGQGGRRRAAMGLKNLRGACPETQFEHWRLWVALRRLRRSPSPGSTRRTRYGGPRRPREPEAHGVDPTGRGDGGSSR